MDEPLSLAVPGPRRTPTVLVVSTCDSILDILKDMTECAGLNVETAGSTEHALACLLTTPYEVVIIANSKLGGLDAEALLDHLEHCLAGEVPAILSTASYDEDPFGSPHMREMFTWMIRKPFEPDEFRAVLQRAVRVRQMLVIAERARTEFDLRVIERTRELENLVFELRLQLAMYRDA